MQLRNIYAFFFLLACTIGTMNAQQTFYWVGSSGGDWHDPDNWDFSSGGFGGVGVPSNIVDAVFDGLSFAPGGAVITVSTNVNCRNLDFRNVTEMPTFQVGIGDTINIDGSLFLSPDMTFDVQSPVVFRSNDTDEEILTNGQAFNNDVIFNSNGSGGAWTLQDDFDQTGDIIIEAGTLNTNDQQISSRAILVPDSGKPSGLDLGSSVVTLIGPFGFSPELIMESNDFNFDPGTSAINLVGDNALINLTGDIPYFFNSIFFSGPNAQLTTETPGGQLEPLIQNLTFNQDGLIQGDHFIQNLEIAIAYTLKLENGSLQTIQDLTTSGTTCDGDARIIAEFDNGPRARLILNQDLYSGPFFFRGIDSDRTGTISMLGGFNGGNNDGDFEFTGGSNIFYWIGDGGDWRDPNNWSRSSGGMSDGCIPKSIDNVIFDDNSFPGGAAAGAMITSDIPVFANSFSFTTSGFVGSINMPSLNIIGDQRVSNISIQPSLIITPERLLWQIDNVFLFGTNTSGMTANTDNLFVEVAPNILNNLFVRGEAGSRINLDTSLIIKGTLDIGGVTEFFTDGFDVSAEMIIAQDAPVLLRLNGSTITVTGTYDGTTYPVTISGISGISAVGTQWIFTDEESGFSIDSGTIGDVTFENDNGTAHMLVTDDVMIGTLLINNDGQFTGLAFGIDSLIFTPGHMYELGGGVDVTVDSYFEGRGDQCESITFRTSGANMSEDFTLASDISLVMSYFVISDIDARGGSFFAGIGSEGDRTNNWTFPTDAENGAAKRFLGEDVAACNDSLITLEPFDASAVMDIRWELNGTDVSTDLAYTIASDATQVIAYVTTPSGCPISDTIQVDFAQSFTLPGQQDRDVCQGAFTTLDAGLTDPSAKFLWNTGETTQTIDVNITDEYTVIVDRGGCVEFDTVDITRIDLEPFDMVFVDDQGDRITELALCENETRTYDAPSFNNSTYTWNDGTSTASIEVSAASLPADGFYIIEVTEGACTDSDSLAVTFDAAITQVMTDMSDTTICAGAIANLSVVAGFDSVNWNVGSMDMTIPVDAQTSRTYVVEGFRGACRTTEERMVAVTQLTDVSLGSDITVCEDATTLDIPKRDGVTLTHRWIDLATGDDLGDADTLAAPIIVGRADYIFEATEGVCFSRDTIGVDVEAAPIFVLNTRDTTLCIGEDLDITVTQEQDVTYSWSTGEDGTTINVSTADDYILTADRGRCSVDTMISVSVLDLGAFSIGPADTTLCQGDVLNLDATLSGNVTYTWFPNNAGLPINQVTTADEYQIEVSSGNCSVNDTIDVSFDTPSSFDLHQTAGALDSTICEGSPLTYDQLNFPNVVWSDFDGNELSTMSDFEIEDAGSYELAVTNGVCVTRDSIIVSVQPRPLLELQDTVMACAGETIILGTPGAPDVEYVWSTAERTNTIEVTQSDFYVVVAVLNNCPNLDTSHVIFNALPDPVLPIDASICDGDSTVVFRLSSLPPGTDFNLMSEPTGSTMITPGVDEVYARVEGLYDLMLTNSDNCELRDTFNLSLNPTPFFTLPDSTGLCDGASQLLSPTYDGNAPANVEYRWSTADGNEEITVRPNDEGQIWLDATIDNPQGGCSWSDTTFVKVQEVPEITLDERATICSDSSLVLDATAPGVTYLWSTGETTASIEVSQADTYSVVIDINGCTDDSEIEVTTIQAPEVSLGMDTVVCDGDAIMLTTGNPLWNTNWSTGETTSSITVSGGALYSVTVEDNGCTDSDDIMIDLGELPVLDLGDDLEICDLVGASLTVSIPNADILWSTGETTSTINITEAGEVSIMATTTDGCVAEDAIDVDLRECSRFGLYVPNVFSRSAQSSDDNQRFIITPSTSARIDFYEINVYDRWGNLVFQSNDINTTWDGTINGFETNGFNPGVFMYAIKVTYSDDFDTDRTDYFRGDITLLD